MGAETQTHLDRRVADLATKQHGVVSLPQLIAIGLTRRAIARRLESGRLHQLYRGVYAVGHKRLTRRGYWMAAVLAAGDGAVLSHRSAAALWGLLPAPTNKIEVTLPTTRRNRQNLVLHCKQLSHDEITTHEGIATTTPSRTIFDLAATTDPRTTERAFNEAEFRRLTDAVPLARLLTRYPRQRGTRLLRELIAKPPVGITKSDLEEAFLAFIDDVGLPRPELNAPLELGPGHFIHPDCMWRKQRLIVELDSRSAHETRSRFDDDRERDRDLKLLGWDSIRVTARHLTAGRSKLARDLEDLLARPR